MDNLPRECGRMASVAREYCRLVDDFDGFTLNRTWAEHMISLLPRLHIAVIALNGVDYQYSEYDFPDDDARCELYMHLHTVMGGDATIWSSGDSLLLYDTVCDRLADDLTDMYFDLKGGLEIIEQDPQQAMHTWQCSFYWHWGRHLLDAEHWLHTVGIGTARLPN